MLARYAQLEAPAAHCYRLPPPWSVEELEACFIVIDSAGQKLAFIYFEDEPGRRATAKLKDARQATAGP